MPSGKPSKGLSLYQILVVRYEIILLLTTQENISGCINLGNTQAVIANEVHNFCMVVDHAKVNKYAVQNVAIVPKFC